MDSITHLPVTEWGCDAIVMFVDRTLFLCLVRVQFPLKNSHSCSLQQWCHGMVCLSGSYLIATAATLVGFGSL